MFPNESREYRTLRDQLRGKRDQEIFHMWGSELMFEKTPGDPRHADLFWPLWGILDLCPEGRGNRWYLSL